MPQFSALFATVLLVLSLFRLYFCHFGGAEVRVQLYAVVNSAYMVLLAFSGWHYWISKTKMWGIVNAVLMLGMAAFISIEIYFNKSDIIGGAGPDANPAGPMLQLFRLIAEIKGIVAFICGIGVGWRSLTPQRNNPHNREPDS